MEPEPLLRHRLPHVAELTAPGTGIARHTRAVAPIGPDLLRDLGRDKLRDPAVHRAEPGGEDDEIGGQLAAVTQEDRALLERAQLHAAANLDLARGDEVRGADVDVVARAGAQRLHHQTRAILSPIEKEARLIQARVEV